jgi:hypothetical protein
VLEPEPMELRNMENMNCSLSRCSTQECDGKCDEGFHFAESFDVQEVMLKW